MEWEDNNCSIETSHGSSGWICSITETEYLSLGIAENIKINSWKSVAIEVAEAMRMNNKDPRKSFNIKRKIENRT